MRYTTCFMLCLCLLGCSDAAPTKAEAQTDTTPQEVLDAWAEFDAMLREVTAESLWDFGVTTALREEDGNFIIMISLEGEPDPMHGGGVVLDPAHMRKKQAWLHTQFLLLGTAEDIDEYRLFSRIDYISNINGVIVNASLSLPVEDQEPITIKLHDPFDGKTYTWPDTGDVPDTGPDHWCFQLFGCSVCKENHILYNPYEDE